MDASEIGFDGELRYAAETRVCTHFDVDAFDRGEDPTCGAAFDVVVDRHSLDDGHRTCERCRRRPTIAVAVWGTTSAGYSVCVFPFSVLTRKTRRSTFERAMKWAREFVRAGGLATLEVTRHTRLHGARTRRIRIG